MYATKADLELRYGVPEVAQLERGLTESQSINTALDDASQIADGYICAYYTVPLEGAPQNLKIYVCDIARYLLWKSRASEEVRQRYEDAISYLKLVASGRAKLLVKNEITEEVKVATKSPSTAPIGTTYAGGVFGDDVLGKMPTM